MIDLTGALINELRADPVVAGLVPPGRIRGATPAPGDAPPMVILVRAGQVLMGPRGGAGMRVQDCTWYARCYGADPIGAAQLSGAVTDAIHNRGPRTDAQGRLIHRSYREGGGEADTDPVTKWPLEVIVIRALGATEAIA